MNVCMSYEDATQYKKISIKNYPFYSFNDMINIESFDLKLLETNKIPCKSDNKSNM